MGKGTWKFEPTQPYGKTGFWEKKKKKTG